MTVEHKSPSAKANGIVVQRSVKRSSSSNTQSSAALPRPRAVLQRAQEDPSSLSAAEVEVLQRTIGPRAVQRMLGAKSSSAAPIVQPKLTVGPVGDKYEQEADAVAKQVMRTPASVQRAQMKNSPEEEEDEGEGTSGLQRKPDIQRAGQGGFQVDSDFEQSLNRSKGSGAPLPDTLRSGFEQKFGAEFSGVRVHTGPQSDQLNRSIQAKAFTSGQDVFFRQGAYTPGSRSGQELIAHELTHVVQQNGDRVRRKEASTSPGQTSDKAISISSTPNGKVQRKFGFEIELPMLFTTGKDYTFHTGAGDEDADGVPVDAQMGGKETKLVDFTDHFDFYLNPDHSRTLDALYQAQLEQYVEDPTNAFSDEVKEGLISNSKAFMPHSASIVEVVTEPWDENTLTRSQAKAKVRKVIQGVNVMYNNISGNRRRHAGDNYYIGSTAPNSDVFQPRLGYFHSTYGVKLSQVPKMFEKTTKQKKKLAKYAQINKPQAEHARNVELTANSVSVAKTVMNNIKAYWPQVTVTHTFGKDTQKMDMSKGAQADFLGFLTLLCNYFLLMKASTSGGDLAKKLVGMHYYKSDMFDVFDQLDDKVKNPLQAGNKTLVNNVIDSICAGIGVASDEKLNGHLGGWTIRQYLFQILRGKYGTMKTDNKGTEQKDSAGQTFMDPVLSGSINPYSRKLGPDQLTGGGKTGLGVVMENRHLEYLDSRYGELVTSSEKQMRDEVIAYGVGKDGVDNRSDRTKAKFDSIGAREGGGGPARRPIGEWEGMMMNIYDMVKSVNSGE